MKKLTLHVTALIGATLLAAAPALAQPKKVAIASMGPHGSLEQVIAGFKQALADKGFVDGKDVVYEYSHGNFDPNLVPQVLTKLEAGKPAVLLTITTPMTQAAVKIVRDQTIPIVFAPVTDPVAAGLVPDWDHGSARFVGASNLQSMEAVLDFAKKLLGDVKSFGMLYNPGDANDIANKNLAETAAKAAGINFQGGRRRFGQRYRLACRDLAGRRFHLRYPLEHADAGVAGDRVRRRPYENPGDLIVAAGRAGSCCARRDVCVLDSGRLSGRLARGRDSEWRQAIGTRQLQAGTGRSFGGHQRQALEAIRQGIAGGTC